MSLRDSQFGELKVSLTWTAAIALIVAAVVAVGLLLTDRRETFRPESYGGARSATDGLLAPVGGALSAPGRWIGAGVDTVRGYFFAVSENHRLKSELGDMRQWRDVALALKNENNRYRSLLGLKTDPPIPMAAARVVIDSRGPFADTRIANTGREAGVKPGNPVMSEFGLVGRVIGVTDGASRVLMLTDVASRTPVMVDRTNARAILTGDGGPNPRLDYLRGQDPVREGDRILTSGDGGIMPRGLPVGAAVKGLDGKWRVVLASDRGPIDFVRILLFQDFTQVINRAELDKTPVPPPTPGAPTEVTAESPSLALAQPQLPASPGDLTPKPAGPRVAGAAPAVVKPAAKPAETKAPVATTGPKPAAAKPVAAKAPDTSKAVVKPAAAKAPTAAKPAAKPPATAPKAATTKPAKPPAAILAPPPHKPLAKPVPPKPAADQEPPI